MNWIFDRRAGAQRIGEASNSRLRKLFYEKIVAIYQLLVIF
jgi:hypothetical protein